jgi:hypothetical protein
MWIVVQSDVEENGFFDVLMDDDGTALKFKHRISAWRYLEQMCKEANIDYELMENDVELWRLH